MNRLSSRNNRLKFKTLGNSPIILKESTHYSIPQFIGEKPKDVYTEPVGLGNIKLVSRQVMLKFSSNTGGSSSATSLL